MVTDCGVFVSPVPLNGSMCGPLESGNGTETFYTFYAFDPVGLMSGWMGHP